MAAIVVFALLFVAAARLAGPLGVAGGFLLGALTAGRDCGERQDHRDRLVESIPHLTSSSRV